ncbi:cytochrome P450 [Desarmillaria tabescens]|uniref:Cytochrome P450 n=1 Tax=Armillaria tabescens TaxID=1929756 RepID=A0AA39KFS7_ARMTA|nr:cytochrome P450 [Desarmillaria tabescens]KAK0460394.1 cytochrome P450 [Desarmillaria tabescens]
MKKGSHFLPLPLMLPWHDGRHLPLPPGPPGRPFVGNSIPPTDAFLQFEEWTQDYGPVFSLKQGGQTTVIIGRYQAACDIMEKEGASLVDRPRSIAAGDTLSGGMRVLLTPAGQRLKRLRKTLSQTYSVTHLSIKCTQRGGCITPLNKLNSSYVRYSASVIMTLTYGKTTPTSYTDPEVQQVNNCLFRLGAAVRPGTYLVDTFPILAYVPSYLSHLKRHHEEELTLFREQLGNVKGKMIQDEELPPSFAKHLLQNQKTYGLSDDEVAYSAGSMFGAGSDTTAAAISFMIMACASFPDAQKWAQEEIDRVVGQQRSPTFGDQELLPCVSAFVLECTRWRPVSISGFAHKATKDIYWQGYVIPAGAAVIGNHWCISRDPEVYPSPNEFIPQRWIRDSDSSLNTDNKPFTFGFGRRVCPGSHVAERSLFLTAAMILWAFNISKSGPIDTMAFTQTANVHPLPFNVDIKPRFEGISDLVSEIQ